MGYYMGDYYAGDPGFFSFLGKVAKGALGIASSVVPGVGGALAKVTSKIPGPVKSGAIQLAKVAAKHPVLSAAGAAGAVTATAGAMRMGSTTHPNVAAARMGRAVRGPRMPGEHRRYRRMNVCNPKALRRAIRRTHGFAKLAMKTIHLTHPKKHVTFGGFRKRRSKK